MAENQLHYFFQAHEVSAIIPMMMVDGHCLLQYLHCSHRETLLGPFAFIDLFFKSVSIFLHMCFLKGTCTKSHGIKKRKKVPVSVGSPPHQERSPITHVYFVQLLVCLDIKHRSTECNTNLLLLLIKKCFLRG